MNWRLHNTQAPGTTSADIRGESIAYPKHGASPVVFAGHRGRCP